MLPVIIEPSPELWTSLCSRAGSHDTSVTHAVESIFRQVDNSGDQALHALSLQLDGVDRHDFRLSPEEIELACAKVPEDLKCAMRLAKANIEIFHQAELPAPIEVEVQPGIVCRQISTPIQRVGLYAPGGRAPLFSTVLMLAVPAKVAGCPEIILCTPPGPDGLPSPAIIYAATLCGISNIYALGGAQAIAAMTFGTQSIPRVNKIFGPGNRYVTAAKQLAATHSTAIDMPAGPSEVMVLADSSAIPEYVAADLLAQAEHGPDSQSIAVVDSEQLAIAVREATLLQAERLPRRDIIMQSLQHSHIIVMPRRETMVEFANTYAPEHLIISMREPEEILSGITAAGSVFMGNYSPESAGDYASGTNHTLPTNGWAMAFGGVNTESFMRKMTVQYLTRDGLHTLAPVITTMAQAEGLDGHAGAVTIRIADL